MKKIILTTMILLSAWTATRAQVKIGNNSGTINANSMLEMESTNKGFLPPRIALNSASSVSPLSATTPAGMTVYSSGGTLADGYYYWNGTKWESISHDVNFVSKTANATLTKSETFVLASNDILLTLPVVTSANDGLAITIKNTGSYTDLITVKGNGSATIDGSDSATLTRWKCKKFIAYNGNWLLNLPELIHDNIYDVHAGGSWTSITEILEFLGLHMYEASVIRLGEGDYPISSTQNINLPYPLTIQGLSYGVSTISAASGLANSPMFSCATECYFKMLSFDGSALASYGNNADEDGIWFTGSGNYHEVKDCQLTHFNRAIVNKTDAELWIFETDIVDAVASGIQMNSSTSGAILKISEVDFTNCAIGIDLKTGSNEVVSIMNCGFYNSSGGQYGLNYTPSTFAPFTDIHITHNIWNNTGTFINGFDFTRSDGRDANAFVQNNAGMGDQNPYCKIAVSNNATTTTVTTASTWYKANWTNTSSSTVKWKITNNKIQYLPSNHKNGWAIITGNIQVGNANRTITIGFVKNGSTGTRYGETDLRLTAANQPFQFSTVVFLSDIGPNDYFELYCTSANSGDVVTFQDIQWYTETK